MFQAFSRKHQWRSKYLFYVSNPILNDILGDIDLTEEISIPGVAKDTKEQDLEEKRINSTKITKINRNNVKILVINVNTLETSNYI